MQPTPVITGERHIMQTLMNTLGYQFKNPALLKQALTHPSMGAEDNQRLEIGRAHV